jgi:DNA-binding NtrC family response regulator
MVMNASPATIAPTVFEVLCINVEPQALGSLCKSTEPIALRHAETISDAIQDISRNRIPVVLCREDALGGGWQELLQRAQTLPEPPAVVVFSNRQDPVLWGRVLSQGGFDVLWPSTSTDTAFRTLQGAFERRRRNLEVAAARKTCVRALSTALSHRAFA